MNIDKLRKELEADEGRVDKIYLDHFGFETFGIGHLVIETDPERIDEILGGNAGGLISSAQDAALLEAQQSTEAQWIDP